MAEDDDRALFERAMQNLTKEDLFDGKFGTSDSTSVDSDLASDEEPVTTPDAEVVREVREFATMEDAFFDVVPIERTKLRIKKTPVRHEEDDEEIPIASPPAREEKKREVVERTPFERFANDTADATVIDCRRLSDTVAFRTLAIEFTVGHSARIVFEANEDGGLDRAALTTWATGLGVDFVFSPDSSETDGLMLIRGTQAGS